MKSESEIRKEILRVKEYACNYKNFFNSNFWDFQAGKIEALEWVLKDG